MLFWVPDPALPSRCGRITRDKPAISRSRRTTGPVPPSATLDARVVGDTNAWAPLAGDGPRTFGLK